MTQHAVLNLGTFEGYNFRKASAIDRLLTAQQVIGWKHDQHGEAEFWPSGDVPLLNLLFPQKVKGCDLEKTTALIQQMDTDAEDALLQICFACQAREVDLEDLTIEKLEDMRPHVFEADVFHDASRDAAHELFETYWPDLYQAWEKDTVGILRFDWEDFLDSGMWYTLEIRIKGRCLFLVAPA
jgi:hypothetical protein